MLFPVYAGAKRQKPTPCPAERYVVVEGGPLVGEPTGPGADVITIAPREMSIAGGCVAKAILKASKSGTTARARWKTCPPLRKIAVMAKIAAPECGELKGTLKAKKTKARRFRAVRSTCGDGHFDPGRETCDAGEGCIAPQQCGATCACATAATAASGVIELPPGSTLSPTGLQVVAPNASAIRADGSFDFDGSAGPTLVLIADGDGVPVLGAFSDPRLSGPLKVNARSTALAMLFFASGAFSRSPSDYPQVRDLLAAHPAFATLAASAEARLGADPHAIVAADAQLLAAIQAALDAMSAPAAPRTASRATAAAVTGQVVSRLVANPPVEQSGIIVADSDDQTGLAITNTRRRHLFYYVRQTGFEDADGKKQSLDRPVVEGAYLPSTTKLAGALGSVIDVLVGHGAYQPFTLNPPLPLPVLPVLPQSAREAYYQLTVVGPGTDPGFDPKLGREPFETGAKEMLAWSVFKDVFLPFLFAGMDAKLDVEEVADISRAFSGLQKWKTILGSSGHLALSLSDPSHFDLKEFMVALFKTIADEPAFRQAIIKLVQDLLVDLAPETAEAIAQSALNGFATKLNFWLAVIDKAMSFGDASVAAHDMANSNWFDEWVVTAIPVPVRLLPAVATVSKAAPSASLTTTVTGLPNRTFVYRYSTTATHGHVCPIIGACGTTVDSTFDNVQYIADPLAIVEGDLDTVTVEVFEDAGRTGTVPAGVPPLGKATSRIVGEIGCAGPETPVAIPSADLVTALRQQLGIAANQPITCADLERLTTLFIVQRNVETLEGLQFATNLTQLTCNQCILRDAAQVSRLRKLTTLSLADNGIVDVSPLAGLTGLTYLNLEFNRIVDAGPLAGLANLTSLNLRGNELNGVSPLAGLTKLEELYLRQTRITSVAALAGLANLETLTLNFNQLETLAGLQAMTKLAHLEIDYNYILTDISALTNLNALTYLDAEVNSIEDIAPLDGKVHLTYLDLSTNYIANLGTVDWSAMPLQQLNLRVNLIEDISPLQGLSNVGDLDLSYNRISNAAPLTGLNTLHALAIRNNLLSSLQALLNNSGLGSGDTLNIQQNCLSESDPGFQTLKNRGVAVYSEPQGCAP